MLDLPTYFEGDIFRTLFSGSQRKMCRNTARSLESEEIGCKEFSPQTCFGKVALCPRVNLAVECVSDRSGGGSICFITETSSF